MTRVTADIPPTSGIPAGPSRDDAHRMFDRISRRYDLLNQILSLGLDIYWRRKLLSRLPVKESLRVLDLATGTGDVALATTIQRRGSSVIGIDKSENMLRLAEHKLRKRARSGSSTLALGDGLAIPLVTSSQGAVTIAFGIRNMPDTKACLIEIERVLSRGGSALILEFSLPGNYLIRKLHLFYLRRVVPFLGRAISGDDYAYRYLNETVESYSHGEEFCSIMRAAGFAEVRAIPLSFGIVTIYEGTKP